MDNVLNEYFNRLSLNNRIGHAFLICNTTFENVKDELGLILNKYFFKTEIDINKNHSDIYILKPTNDKIIKEDILNLQSNLKTLSQFNENRVYIIDHAEMMNDYAANSLLKFLEEPEKNIYAFLITSNIDKVISTIKSRCQILVVQNGITFDKNEVPIEILNKTVSFINDYENMGLDIITKYSFYFDKKEDRENFKIKLKVMKYFYRDILNKLIYDKVLTFNEFEDIINKIANKNSEKSIINKLIILNKFENMLEYNLNINLFLDNLIIEMEGY